MALLATPLASHLGVTTFGGFGAGAIATGSRGRATTDLVGAFTASSVLSPTSAFSVAVASPFPAAATCTISGVQGIPRVRSLLAVSRKSMMSLSHSLDDLVAAGDVSAGAVARCQVPCLRR